MALAILFCFETESFKSIADVIMQSGGKTNETESAGCLGIVKEENVC